MKLREKILLLCGLALTACAYLLYFASSRMFLDNFRRLEAVQADQAVRQALHALDERLGGLQVVNVDWAQWDDSYRFMIDPSDSYKSSNLNSESLAGLRLNLIAYVDPAGSAVYETGFDYIAHRFRPVPAAVKSDLLSSTAFLQRCLSGEAVKGILVTPEGTMMIAAHAILPSHGEGDARGMLVMGRMLDVREMTDLRRVSGQTLNLYPVDDPVVAAEARAAVSVQAIDPPVTVGTPSENVVAAYAMVRDVFGKPALTLRTVAPRNILSEGRRTVNKFLVALICTGLLATVIVAGLFERLVLSPLARLRSDVAWTAARGVASGRIPAHGNDEIAQMAQEINRLLDTREQVDRRAQDRAARHADPSAVETTHD
jgi:sensor domain CHASE-containing protein